MLNDFFSKVLSLALLGIFLWFSWPYIGPHKPVLGPLRQELAEQMVVEIAEDLRLNKAGVVSAVLVHFENDPTDYISEALSQVLEQRGTFDLLGPPLPYRLRKVLNMRQPSHNASEKAAETARAEGLDAAIIGRVIGFESYQGGTKAEIEYTLVGADGGTIHKGTLSREITNTWTAPALPASAASFWQSGYLQNGLVWLMVMLLLPIITIAFIRTAARKNSNSTNAFVLAVYTLLSTIAAYIIAGTGLAGIWLTILLLAAALISLAYNIKILSFAIKLEEE